jgi:hypothetical protein
MRRTAPRDARIDAKIALGRPHGRHARRRCPPARAVTIGMVGSRGNARPARQAA